MNSPLDKGRVGKGKGEDALVFLLVIVRVSLSIQPLNPVVPSL